MDASLVINEGTRRETRALTTPSVTFGRSKACDIVLSDKAISSQHFRILRHGQAFVLRDLGSKNATFVNEEKTSDRILRKGDRIRVGTTTIEFYLGEVPPTLPAAPAQRRKFHWLGAAPAPPRGNVRLFLSVLGGMPPYLLSTSLHAVALVLLMTIYITVQVASAPDATYQVTLVQRAPDIDLAAASDGEHKGKPGPDSDPFSAPQIAAEAHVPAFEPDALPAARPGMTEVPDLPPVVRRGNDAIAVLLPKKPGSKTNGASDATTPPQGGKVDLPDGVDIAGIVLGRLKGRPGDFETYGSLTKDNIVVITGVYDHVETVLDGLLVPHATVTPKKFDRLKTEAACAILVDCPGYLNGTECQRVRKWVADGGYLFTTDWTLGVLATMFPGMVRRGGQQTSEDWVTVGPAKGMDEDPLLKDVFSPLKGHPQWWLEEGTFPIQVQDREKVRVLIDSSEMRRRYGEGAVAVTFDYGKGKVLHVASHFYQVSTDMKTHYSMTQLIVNFLLQARQAQAAR